MDDFISHQKQQKDKERSLIATFVFHFILIVLAMLPFMSYQIPPPGQEGILVNLGLPDVGQGDENAGPAETAEEEEETIPEEEVQPEPQPETPREETKPEPVKEKEVIKTEDPEAIALRRKKEQEKKAQEEQERVEREEARKKAEADAKKKAEAEAEARRKADAQKTKDQIGGLFGNGKGKGNTGKPGNQGDPGGDPNSDILTGISTGSGKVGGGLGSRGVSSSPKVTDNSQKQGTVVLEVCVDGDGNVTSAKYTQRGSSTTDSQLVSVAEANARRWKFTPGGPDKQCGTITYNFKLQ
ncbi:MAG: energy transducer TonB [Saprospiraceae bacterium]|nr:energy transducer TonB [Saprospiraceae bacterium]